MKKETYLILLVFAVLIIGAVLISIFQPECGYSGYLSKDKFDSIIIGQNVTIINDCNIKIIVNMDNVIVICKDDEVVVTDNLEDVNMEIDFNNVYYKKDGKCVKYERKEGDAFVAGYPSATCFPDGDCILHLPFGSYRVCRQ